MDSKSYTAAAYRVEHPSTMSRRSRRGLGPQAVRADNPRARDPQAYPYYKPRPKTATRPVISVEWTEIRKTPEAVEPVVIKPIPLKPVSRVTVLPEPAAPEPVIVEPVAADPARLMPSQRAHLLRPLTLRGHDGRQTYVTYTFDRQHS